mmetsp:Transcript_7657/g.26376  ORF Transcript_7657/g.26376 Transcript_7657/m.26376 type:complete len:205 (+) Transcript_7657:391-1005(+)
MVRTASQVVLHPAGSNESITVGQGRSAEPSLEVLLQDLLQDPHHGDIGDLVWRWARQRPAHVPVALAIRAHRREQEALPLLILRRIGAVRLVLCEHAPQLPHAGDVRHKALDVGNAGGKVRARDIGHVCLLHRQPQPPAVIAPFPLLERRGLGGNFHDLSVLPLVIDPPLPTLHHVFGAARDERALIIVVKEDLQLGGKVGRIA